MYVYGCILCVYSIDDLSLSLSRFAFKSIQIQTSNLLVQLSNHGIHGKRPVGNQILIPHIDRQKWCVYVYMHLSIRCWCVSYYIHACWMSLLYSHACISSNPLKNSNTWSRKSWDSKIQIQILQSQFKFDLRFKYPITASTENGPLGIRSSFAT